MTAQRTRRIAPWLLAGLLLSGCGVGLQNTAEPLPSDALPSAAPTPSQTPTARETEMCFVNGVNLERVAEPITSHTADAVMSALAAGPPPERRDDLRTLLLDPLTAAPVLAVVKITAAGEVVVRHTEDFLQLQANDQVLLMGQVACSMDAVGLERVLLIDPMGQPVPIPLPDLRVREGPVTAQDYEVLIEDRD